MSVFLVKHHYPFVEFIAHSMDDIPMSGVREPALPVETPRLILRSIQAADREDFEHISKTPYVARYS